MESVKKASKFWRRLICVKTPMGTEELVGMEKTYLSVAYFLAEMRGILSVSS